MHLGNFSLSLNVKDIRASKAFYEKLGFRIFAGHIEQNWLIMKSPSCVIGLFQSMLDKNTLTFNPGWDDNGQSTGAFTDIRDLQAKLKSEGISFTTEVEEGTKGPGRAILMDPDGNPILIDQHV